MGIARVELQALCQADWTWCVIFSLLQFWGEWGGGLISICCNTRKFWLRDWLMTLLLWLVCQFQRWSFWLFLFFWFAKEGSTLLSCQTFLLLGVWNGVGSLLLRWWVGIEVNVCWGRVFVVWFVLRMDFWRWLFSLLEQNNLIKYLSFIY